MASRYDIALDKGPAKTVYITFSASSNDEARILLKYLTTLIDVESPSFSLNMAGAQVVVKTESEPVEENKRPEKVYKKRIVHG